MKHFLHRTFLILLFTGLTVTTGMAQTADNGAPLTNASIVRLARAGFKEKTILSIIAALPSAYDLSPERMIELKRSGVSENIILGMLARQSGSKVTDDTWADDPFFDQNSDKRKENQKSRTGNSTDVFGSSGTSQGSTRNRAGRSSVSGDTETTGSVTVRILRPPAEASPPQKLEKAAALTNDSIVELVEAGFSDGTIIRRIELSPVEFDLSPAKLAELRKHGVSDKILAAMKTAMGDDSSTNKPGSISNGPPKPK